MCLKRKEWNGKPLCIVSVLRVTCIYPTKPHIALSPLGLGEFLAVAGAAYAETMIILNLRNIHHSSSLMQSHLGQSPVLEVAAADLQGCARKAAWLLQGLSDSIDARGEAQGAYEVLYSRGTEWLPIKAEFYPLPTGNANFDPPLLLFVE